MKYETLVSGCKENEHTVPLHCLCANGLKLGLLLAFLAVIHEGLNGPLRGQGLKALIIKILAT